MHKEPTFDVHSAGALGTRAATSLRTISDCEHGLGATLSEWHCSSIQSLYFKADSEYMAHLNLRLRFIGNIDRKRGNPEKSMELLSHLSKPATNSTQITIIRRDESAVKGEERR